MRRLYTIALVIAVCLPVLSQNKDKSTNQKPAEPAPAIQSPRAALNFGLNDGTPLKLRISRTISSADAKEGETIDFEVLEDVKVSDVVIIPRGGTALGTVTEAQPKRRMGRAGKLNVNIDSVRLVSGEKIALRAVKEVQGGGNTGKMTGAIIATSIIFFPAAPLFLFVKGKDITIPKGTEITAYSNGDIELDKTKFASKEPAASAPSISALPAITTSTEADSSLVIKSTPEGAEIAVDGKFVGNTPSTLRLKAGDRTITISKSGYTSWERSITLTASGSITLDAQLEKKQ